MPGVDRNNPVRAESSDSRMSIMEFMREFPDDASCLEWLWRERLSGDGEHAECPKCERERKFHKLAQHPAWSCDTCGHHLHPTAGTIYHKSSTSLQLWFYAQYLMASTRCGVSAKHLERELGVTYKTAWRIANRIRNQLMTQDGDEPLSGDVEVDETAGGGKVRASDTRKGRQHVIAKMSNRPTIFGAVERGGRVRAMVVESRSTRDLEGAMFEFVLPTSMIFTDEWGGYSHRVGSRYIAHRRIRHEDKIYVSGDVHTQTIDGFFGNLKNGIRGNYHSVSSKWLQGYLNEYAFRYNRRGKPERIFSELLLRSAVGR
jgi:transposase-like protein